MVSDKKDQLSYSFDAFGNDKSLTKSKRGTFKG